MDLTFQKIIKMVVEDWKLQVKDMSDEELLEDRSHWMKHYGRTHYTSLIDEMEVDIHTITIECEQLRRFSEIIYGNPEKKKDTKRITEE